MEIDSPQRENGLDPNPKPHGGLGGEIDQDIRSTSATALTAQQNPMAPTTKP